MTVAEKSFQMSLGVTMDQSIPAEVLPNDRLAKVVNARCRKPGQLSKRYGYGNLVRTRLDTGTNITAGKRFIKRETERTFTDGHFIWAYVPTQAKWVKRDRIPEAQVLQHQTVIEDGSQGKGYHDASVAVAGNYACIIVRDLNGSPNFSLYARIIHLDTGGLLDATTIATNTVGFAEVIAVGSTFIVVYRESGGNLIRARTFPTLGTPAWTSVTTLRNDNNASGLWKTAVSSTAGTFILVHYTTGASLDAYTYDTSLAGLTSSTGLRAGKTVDLLGIEVVGSTLYIALHNSTDNAVECMGRNDTTLASTFAVQTLAAATTISSLVVGKRTTISAWVVWAILGSTSTPFANQSGMAYRGIGVGGSVDASTQTTYGVCPASHPFFYDDHAYICAYAPFAAGSVLADPTQKCLLVLDLGNDEVLGGDSSYRCRPVARWGEADIYEGNSSIVSLTGAPAGNVAGTFLVAYTWQDFEAAGSGRGGKVKFTKLNFDDTAAVRWVGQSLVGNDTMIPAGLLHCYDGVRCFEAGFAYYPVIAEVLAVAAGTLTVPETYEYVAVYTKIDANGRLWRSAPSAIGSINLSGANQQARVRILYYGATSMSDSTSSFTFRPGVEVYRRSIANPTFTRLTKSTTGPVMANDSTSATYIQFDDDGTYTTNDQPELYSEGGVLENITPPPCRFTAIYDNRVWLSGLDDPEVLNFSSEIVDGEGIRFHPDLNIRIDDGKGIQAMAVQDGSLVVLKGDADGIFYIQGTGPDDLGNGNAYNAPQKIMTAPGCIDPRSVLVGDPGIFFQSLRGIEVLTRGPGQVAFAGSPVEDIVAGADAVAAAVYEPNSGEYRFCVSAANIGTKVVYTDLTKTWAYDLLFASSAHADHVPVDAMVLNGVYHWLSSTGFVFTESTSDYHDTKGSGPVWISSGFTTGHIALAGPLGQPRHFRVALLGRKVGVHGLTLVSSLDQGATSLQTKTWTSTEVDAFKWLPIELPEAMLTSQQGRSVQVTVADLPDVAFSEVGTAGPIWYHLLIEYGGEKMPLTVPPTNRK